LLALGKVLKDEVGGPPAAGMRVYDPTPQRPTIGSIFVFRAHPIVMLTRTLAPTVFVGTVTVRHDAAPVDIERTCPPPENIGGYRTFREGLTQ
jgi:hypothetical protein